MHGWGSKKKKKILFIACAEYSERISTVSFWHVYFYEFHVYWELGRERSYPFLQQQEKFEASLMHKSASTMWLYMYVCVHPPEIKAVLELFFLTSFSVDFLFVFYDFDQDPTRPLCRA